MTITRPTSRGFIATEVESMILIQRWSGMMHDIVRTFIQKHGLDESLSGTPEVAWEWIYDSLRNNVRGPEAAQRDELARACCQSIRARMRAAAEGGHGRIH